MGNRKLLFNLLFEASHHTLNTLGPNKKWLGAQPGITSILHTNGQDLKFHPHVHCIVTGGGIDTNGKWVKEKVKNGSFIFPKPLLEKTFKTYFLKQLNLFAGANKLQLQSELDFSNLINELQNIRWNVAAKAPFGGPAQIVEYLGRYTHKVAITAHRIIEVAGATVTFKYKDYKDGDKIKLMTLTHEEFLRRFELHILPKSFTKIRHAGFLTSRNKLQRIANILTQLQLPQHGAKVVIPLAILSLIKTGRDVTICPKCEIGKLELLQTLINVNGKLIDKNDLNNRGSPIKNKTLMP